ncbi:MAG: hypothetical protein WDO71_19130 [Bacteroidota bacterium]
MTADTLMSSRAGKPKVILPTNSFDINPYLDSDATYKPDSLAQKLYIIGGNVCVAVAGDEYEIVQFLRELKSRCKLFDRITEPVIRTFLNDYDLNAQLTKSAFFLICIEHRSPDSIYVGMFNYPQKIQEVSNDDSGGWKVLNNDVYGEVYACGSGTESFLNIVKQTGIFETRHSKGDIWYAIQSNVSLIAKMLAIERTTLHNLQTHWGGGFETAFYNRKEFEKMSDIVYVLCNGQFDKDGDIGLPFPGVFLYYTYKEQTLHIVRVEVKKFRRQHLDDRIILTAEPDNFTADCFVVEELDAPVETKSMSDDFSFKTHRVAMGYGIVTPTNGVFNPSSLNVHGSLTVTYEHGKQIEMILSQEICETIRTSAKKVFDANWREM